jgi:hypothetical protein
MSVRRFISHLDTGVDRDCNHQRTQSLRANSEREERASKAAPEAPQETFSLLYIPKGAVLNFVELKTI